MKLKIFCEVRNRWTKPQFVTLLTAARGTGNKVCSERYIGSTTSAEFFYLNLSSIQWDFIFAAMKLLGEFFVSTFMNISLMLCISMFIRKRPTSLFHGRERSVESFRLIKQHVDHFFSIVCNWWIRKVIAISSSPSVLNLE